MSTGQQLIIRHVRQEDPMGCFVAAMAMIAGKTYQQVKAETGDKWTNGATYYAVDQYLAQNGFAIARFWSYDQFRSYTESGAQRNERFNPWPLLPFAPVHVLQVNVSSGSHWIVMLEDGTILDPATDRPNHLVDYIEVTQMCGVWKVAADR